MAQLRDPNLNVSFKTKERDVALSPQLSIKIIPGQIVGQLKL